MGRLRRHMYEEYGSEYSTDEHYNMAFKKVKRIKGFYSHLKVYIIVNAIIIISSLNRNFFGSHFSDSGLFDWETYSTGFYWGLVLIGHALSVFGRELFFSDDWEQKKIQKYMEKEAAAKKRWE